MEHGGRLAAARARFPGAPEPWIDLSTGINPVPYTIPPLPAEPLTRLPEPEHEAALRDAAARAYGVPDSAMVVAAPGTQILIGLLPHLLPMPRAGIVSPSYGEHAPSWRAAGAAVSLLDEPEAVPGGALVVVNPNNPDGRRWAPDALLRQDCALLVVDEAFADLDATPSLAPLLEARPVVVLRSFGKTYGLAGLRLGFALAPVPIATRLRSALGPWAVSGTALAIGTQALADAAWRARTAERCAREAQKLDSLLQGAGFQVVGGTRLFRLAEHAGAAGRALRLARAGILVRDFADHLTWLRFGLPPDESAWTRLAAALAHG